MKLAAVAFKYLKKYPLQTAVICVLILAASIFEGASFGMLIPLIQSMTNQNSALFSGVPLMGRLQSVFSAMPQTQLISIVFIMMFSMMLLKNVFTFLSSVAIAKLRFRIIRDLRVKLMDKVLEYDMQFFDKVKTGHLVTTVNEETNRMGTFMLAILQFLVYLARIGAYLALLFIISWKVSILVFALAAGVLIPVELVMHKLKILGQHTSKALADYNHKLFEILSGVRVIKARSAEDLEKSSFAAVAGDVSRYQYISVKYMQLIMPLSEVLIFGLIGACFLIALNVFKIDTGKAFPFIATYLLALVKMLAQLNAVNNSRSEALNQVAAFESYEKVYDDAGKRTILSGNTVIPKFMRGIELKNVTFSYEKGKDVLTDISLAIPKGRITAFVGPSGAGKSTLVNLIPRFYDVSQGAILVDGTDIRDLSLKEWRRKIGFISQDVFIFNMSIKDNIRYGHPEISDEDVVKAAQMANAHQFIEELPKGYDTMVGERGVRLSGGQKQRLSIARAIIHDPEVLILDEATSSLDTETERLITLAIDRLTKDRTVVAIAHRLSTIFHADNIVVLNNGLVVETGDHNSLISKDGPYKKLYEAQFASQQKV